MFESLKKKRCVSLAEVYLYEGQCIYIMPFTVEWWPAQHLTASLMQHFTRPNLPLARIKMHRGGIRRKTMACHLAAVAWIREMLCVSLSFKRTGVLANNSKCACAFVFTFTVLFRIALDHWNVPRHQKKPDTSKQGMFAKLWGMLSGDLVTFVLFRVLWEQKKEKKKKKRQRDGRSAPLSV